ncbi:hypothetical protein [Azonexus sp.]|uniref:hypothetical protein n=1 Tax=Azonexus sp. TaxID=1872668 RepID=UPI0035B0CD9D
MDINTFLTALAAQTIVLGVVGFLSKSIVVHFLNKDVELFKSKLQADASKQIEDFKSTLEIERTRLQISYGGIFAKQADVLMRLYELLLNLEAEINSGIVGVAAWNEYQEKLDAYKIYYHENRALIPEELDAFALEAMRVGREILSDSLKDERSSTLVPVFRGAKEKCLSEIRKLLAVVVPRGS